MGELQRYNEDDKHGEITQADYGALVSRAYDLMIQMTGIEESRDSQLYYETILELRERLDELSSSKKSTVIQLIECYNEDAGEKKIDIPEVDWSSANDDDEHHHKSIVSNLACFGSSLAKAFKGFFKRPK